MKRSNIEFVFVVLLCCAERERAEKLLRLFFSFIRTSSSFSSSSATAVTAVCLCSRNFSFFSSFLVQIRYFAAVDFVAVCSNRE